MSRRPGRNTSASKEPGDYGDVPDIALGLSFPICKMGGKSSARGPQGCGEDSVIDHWTELYH